MTKTREQLVITESVETAGAVSYWRIASEVKLDTLASAWRAAALDEKLLPAPPKDEVALGRAVNDQAEKRRLVRPLARRGVWAIVEERVTSEQAKDASEFHLKPVTYRTLVTVTPMASGAATLKLSDTAYLNMVDATAQEYATFAAAIPAAFNVHRNMLAHHDVSSWLLDIAYKQLGAVSLRDSGGVYFIPRPGIEHWNKVSDAIEKGSAGTIFRIPAMRTAEAVAAITDAITAEAEAAAEALEVELALTGEDALGKRALAGRTKLTQELLAKISSYEDLLGRQLAVRERVSSLQAALSAVVLSGATDESEAA